MSQLRVIRAGELSGGTAQTPGLTLCPRARLTVRPPGPSQFFAVHPGWQRWRPPPAEAH